VHTFYYITVRKQMRYIYLLRRHAQQGKLFFQVTSFCLHQTYTLPTT